MPVFRIAIVGSTSELATLKVLRSISSVSLDSLRRVFGTSEAAFEISTGDYPPGMNPEEGQRHQQRLIVDVCDRLEASGATLELGYSVRRGEGVEIISRAMTMNLFASDLECLHQDHD